MKILKHRKSLKLELNLNGIRFNCIFGDLTVIRQKDEVVSSVTEEISQWYHKQKKRNLHSHYFSIRGTEWLFAGILHRLKRTTFDNGPFSELLMILFPPLIWGNANSYFSIVVWVKGEKDKCVLRYTWTMSIQYERMGKELKLNRMFFYLNFKYFWI